MAVIQLLSVPIPPYRELHISILRECRGQETECPSHPHKHYLFLYNTICYMFKMKFMNLCN